MRALWAWAGCLVLACFAGETAGAQSAPPPFIVIVHPHNPAGSASGAFLSDAFLKKATRWADGEALSPVDQKPNSEARRRFSESVLKRSVAAVRNYWQQRIFSGRGVPPPELDSDEAVVSYVLRNRGAVGYVSGSAKVGEAKTIGIR